MTKRKEVSEKSLELNLCAELLQRIRSWHGCERAVWLGMTQRQERKSGLDEMIRNAPGVAMMLQMKSPWARSRVDYLYKFTLNQKQHAALEPLAAIHPAAVYYVFPLYSRWSKANQYAPELLRDTWFVPVSCITLDPSATKSSFTIELWRTNSQIEVSGRFIEVSCGASNARELLEESTVQTLDSRLLSLRANQLAEWLAGLDESSVRFRHLSALYVPY